MRKTWRIKLGVFLIILSAIAFLSLLVIPFFKFDGKTLVSITTGIIVIGEVLFWTGGLLVGKEIWNKYKSFLNPINWFKKRNNSTEN